MPPCHADVARQRHLFYTRMPRRFTPARLCATQLYISALLLKRSRALLRMLLLLFAASGARATYVAAATLLLLLLPREERMPRFSVTAFA